MRRFERLGLAAALLAAEKSSTEKIMKATKSLAYLGRNHSGASTDCIRMVLLQHIELDPPIANVFQFAEEGKVHAEEYFFGSWRRERAPEGYREFHEAKRGERGWFDKFRDGFLLSLLLGKDGKVFLEWVDEDLHIDDGAFEYVREDNYFYYVLAWSLLSIKKDKCKEYVRKIEQSRSAHAKNMLKTWQAIEGKDGKAVSAGLTALCKQHVTRRSRINPRIPLLAVDVDASILAHLAAERGIMPEVEEWVSDYLIRKATLGGKGIRDILKINA